MRKLSISAPDGRTYVVEGYTQIGRSPELGKWVYEDRPKPDDFERINMLIVLESTGVSRSHAGIFPSENGFYLVDFKSMNGTYLNGEPVRRYVDISEGDTIGFGLGGPTLRIDKTFDTVENYALLVGHTGGNLRGVRKDLDELGDRLSRRNFQVVRRMYDPKKIEVLQALDEVARSTTSDSHFLFHYSGHGSGRGLSLDSTVTPSELYTNIRNIRGKKAIILDNCRAGVFVNDENRNLIPPQSLVLAGSSERGKAYERREAIAGGEYMGRFTAALVEFLDSKDRRFNLRDFEAVMRNTFGDPPFSMYYQEPNIAGSQCFTVHTMKNRKEPEAKIDQSSEFGPRLFPAE